MSQGETRRRDCGWRTTDSLLLRYHDEEWGVPIHDDAVLFEHLVLDGAQAGLSWSTILHRREAYREVFQGFDPSLVAGYTAQDVARLLADARIIRNCRKIEAAVGNPGPSWTSKGSSEAWTATSGVSSAEGRSTMPGRLWARFPPRVPSRSP